MGNLSGISLQDDAPSLVVSKIKQRLAMHDYFTPGPLNFALIRPEAIVDPR